VRDNPNFVDLAFQSGSEGRRDSQSEWQKFVGLTHRDTNILDVGSGLGQSRPRLSINNNRVTLLEPAPNMPADITGIIDDQEDSSYELVTAFDVIEHLEEDVKFLGNLFRVCSNKVFLTTPNFNVFGCKNKYHIREYKPEELADLCHSYSDKLEFYVSHNTNGFQPTILSEDQFRVTKCPALAVYLLK
jgi:hypothetical protein